MRLLEFISVIEDSDEDTDQHEQALKTTGFWGSAGAGGLILSKDTGRFLIAHRSDEVEEPNTWNLWGGAINSGMSPEGSVKEEIGEETGYSGPMKLIPLYVFKDTKSSFRFYNFLVLIDKEFSPKLDWEAQGYKWVNYGNWPSPIHFGLNAVLNDPKSIEIINRELSSIKQQVNTKR